MRIKKKLKKYLKEYLIIFIKKWLNILTQKLVLLQNQKSDMKEQYIK